MTRTGQAQRRHTPAVVTKDLTPSTVLTDTSSVRSCETMRMDGADETSSPCAASGQRAAREPRPSGRRPTLWMMVRRPPMGSRTTNTQNMTVRLSPEKEGCTRHRRSAHHSRPRNAHDGRGHTWCAITPIVVPLKCALCTRRTVLSLLLTSAGEQRSTDARTCP